METPFQIRNVDKIWCATPTSMLKYNSNTVGALFLREDSKDGKYINNYMYKLQNHNYNLCN